MEGGLPSREKGIFLEQERFLFFKKAYYQVVNAIINLPYNLKKGYIFQKGAFLRAISVSFF